MSSHPMKSGDDRFLNRISGGSLRRSADPPRRAASPPLPPPFVYASGSNRQTGQDCAPRTEQAGLPGEDSPDDIRQD